MREKLFLLLFGIALGSLSLWAVKPLLLEMTADLPEGAHFESVEEFQRAMLKRDERDTKPGGSVSLRSIITPHPSEEIMYDLLPNLSVNFQGVPVRTNSCGMRGREIALDKPEKVYRIAFLGDSFTFGWGVEEEEAFPWVVERLLRVNAQDGISVEILNLGVPGYSTFQQVALFEEKGLDFQPDAVVLFFIDNDFGLPFFINSIKHKGKVLSADTFARASWKGDDPEILEQKRELEALLDPNRGLMRLARLGKRHGYDFFLSINPRPDWREDFKRLRPAIKRTPNLTHVPLRKRFLEIVERRGIIPSALSLKHDPHPSALKHEILGELLAAALLPQFRAFEESFSQEAQ